MNDATLPPASYIPDDRDATGIIARPRYIYLRQLLRNAEQFLCLTDCEEEEIKTETVTATSIKSKCRDPEPMALRTVVRNNGPERISLYEEDFLIRRIESGEQAELGWKGRLELGVKTASGTSEVETVTYLRCVCTDPRDFTPASPADSNFLL